MYFIYRQPFMTKQHNSTDTTRAGEAIIRHWFRRSLAIILGVGIIAAGIVWYLGRDSAPDIIIEEAVVSGPVVAGTHTAANPSGGDLQGYHGSSRY